MAAECDVLSEIEVLQSIYLDELQVSKRDEGGWEVRLVLHPSTAEDSVSQFVRLTLSLALDLQYPSSPPTISIYNPRGLSDDKLNSLQRCLQAEAETSLGSPVLYQLIEKAKEILTDSNIPHGNCVICLFGFQDGEVFTKTGCYHYFHSHCLGRYVSHSERELQERERELKEDKSREWPEDEEMSVVCPVCREPLIYNVDQLLSSPVPCGSKLEVEVLGAEFRQQWAELQKLLERQRAKGGIIDPEVESNRFLIHINEAPADEEDGNLNADSTSSQTGPCQSPPSQSAPTNLTVFSEGPSNPREQRPPSQRHSRGGSGPRRQGQQRGARRGGRGGPHHRRPLAPTDQLDRLSLASDVPHGPFPDAPQRTRAQAGRSQQKPGTMESNQPEKAAREDFAHLHPEAGPPPADTQKLSQPSLDVLNPVDREEPLRGQGRRRGPHRPRHHANHWHNRPRDALPGEHPQWDGWGPRSRGGAGTRHGRGRGLHHRGMEREGGEERVL